MKKRIFFSVFAMLPGLALAQVALTFTGTMTATAGPYTTGQSVTFSYVLNDYSPTAPYGFAGAYFHQWDEQTLTNPELFESVSGTGMTGTWTRPNASSTSPASLVVAYDADHPSNANRLALSVGRDSGTTGLTIGGNELYVLNIEGIFTGLVFESGTGHGSLPNPATFFSNYTGTYNAAQSTVTFSDATFQSYNLTIQSLEISMVAVPEPSTTAAGIGIGALAFGLLYRRRLVRGRHRSRMQ